MGNDVWTVGAEVGNDVGAVGAEVGNDVGAEVGAEVGDDVGIAWTKKEEKRIGVKEREMWVKF